MATLEEAARAVKSSLGTKQNKIEWQIATLGDGKGNVDAGNGYVFVRLKENSSTVEIINDGVSLTDGMLVRIEKPAHDPLHWHVVSKNDQRIDEVSTDPPGYNIGPHHRTHEYLGVDQVNADFRQITNLRVYAVSGTFTVGVLVGLIPRGGTNVKVPSQTLDLTSHVPATGARYCLISVDSTGALVVTDGSIVDGIITLAITDIPATPSGNWRLAAIRLYAGQTAISESNPSNDMVDLRFPEERIAGNPLDVFGVQTAYSIFGVGTSPALPSFIALSTNHIQSGIFSIARGGTNAATANAALNNLLPTQAGQAGNVLGTDGFNTSWVAPGGGGGGGTIVITSLPIGTIAPFGGSSIPSGWLECNGAAVSRATYADLFAVTGTTYGAGDGSTTFNLPDMRGRTSIGQGTGSGLTPRSAGQTGGEETHVLITAEMPAHTHGIDLYDASSGTPVTTKTGNHTGNIATIQSGSTGGDGAHNTMPPFLVTTWIIKYTDTATSAFLYDDAGATISQVTLTASGTGVRIYAARDDHHHQLDQTIAPTMTGAWTFKGHDVNSIGDDQSAAFIHTQYSATKTASFLGQRARGSLASPSAIQANDTITRLIGRGYGATAFGASHRGAVEIVADENWTDSAQGARIDFYATPNGGTTTAVSAHISNGNFIASNIIASALTLVDDFGRADTSSTLGTAPTGQTWTVYNPFSATYGITSGRVVASDTIYPYVQSTLKTIRAGGKFSIVAGSGANPSGIAIVATADNTLLNNMVHCVFTQTQWIIQVRQGGGAFETLAIGTLSLAADGTVYEAYVNINGNTVTVELPDGTVGYATDSRVDSLYGYGVIYELYMQASSTAPRWESVELKQIPRGAFAPNAASLEIASNLIPFGNGNGSTTSSTQLAFTTGSPGHLDLVNAYPKATYTSAIECYITYGYNTAGGVNVGVSAGGAAFINTLDNAGAFNKHIMRGVAYNSNDAVFYGKFGLINSDTVQPQTILDVARNANASTNSLASYTSVWLRGNGDRDTPGAGLQISNATNANNGAIVQVQLDSDGVHHHTLIGARYGGTETPMIDYEASAKFVGIGTYPGNPAARLHVVNTTTTTNAALEVARIEARVSTASTGGAAGFGPALSLYGESATDTSYRPMGRVSSLWQTATDASAVADMVLEAYYNNGGTFTATEFLRGRGGASAAIGFLTATPIARYSSTGDLRQALIDFGLYTTGGASPLNLNGGLLTAGSAHIGDAATNYSAFAADGTLTMTGTAKVLKEVQVTVMSTRNGASAPTDANRAVGASGNILLPVKQFSKTTQNDIYFELHPGSDIDSSVNVAIHFMWLPGSGWTSGNYLWNLEYLVKDENAAPYNTGTPTTITANVTPSNATDTIETVFGSTIALTWNQTIWCHFFRDVADTGDDTGDLRFVEMEYTANKLGE